VLTSDMKIKSVLGKMKFSNNA